MELSESLEKAGLNAHEAHVYLVLLETGMTTAKAIIEKTGLHRQIVYDCISSLIDKGLASYVIQANRKHFQAVDPERFLSLFEKKKQELAVQQEEFMKILPQLTQRKSLAREEQQATLFLGNKGIVSLLDDMLHQVHEILTIGASDPRAEAFGYHLRFNLPKFHKTRIEKRIPIKILFSDEMKERAASLNKLRFTQARLLSKEFTSNLSTNIYGNKTSLILWGNQPLGVLIKSQDISKAQKKYFNLLWAQASK